MKNETQHDSYIRRSLFLKDCEPRDSYKKNSYKKWCTRDLALSIVKKAL